MQSTSGTGASLDPTGFEADIVSGECQTSAAQLAANDVVRCGLWECTPGVWRSHWASWEVFTVISGSGTLTDSSGTVHQLRPAEVVFIPAGTSGVWNVTETIRKSFVAPAKRVR